MRVSTLLLLLCGLPLMATVQLAPLFADNMVLPRDVRAPIWGAAAPGETVTIALDGKTVTARAGDDGKWTAQLPPLKMTTTPFDFTVAGTNTLTIHNVLVGDVYLCSGQSNMQKPIGLNPPQRPCLNYEQEIATANYPTIRLFDVGLAQAFAPQTTCRGQWQVCSPQTAGRFSAAAYFFARQLVNENGVPIGLVTSTWGGTSAQMWTSIATLKQTPHFQGIAARGEELAAFAGKTEPLPWTAFRDLAQQYKKQWLTAHDPGLTPGKEWTAVDYDDAGWKTMKVPSGLWSSAGPPEFEGMIWYRRAVEVPADWAGKELTLSSFSGYNQENATYFNGVNIDDKRTPKDPNVFAIPAALVKPGKNVIAVRVIGVNGAGGVQGNPNDVFLAQVGDATAKIPLAGQWPYRIGIDMAQVGALPLENALPGTLYNAMIAPLAPFAVKGVLWYQGESDMTGGTHQYYRDVLGALIADWRGLFKQPELPFLIVQLPNIGGPSPFPTGYAPYARVREAQLATVLHTPRTALVITIDIGEPDIHPINKQDVGKRLALAAQALIYGNKREACGPLFAGMTVEGNKARLRFAHAGGGLKTQDGGSLKGFAIAGADGRFVLADASIDGDTVIVSAPTVDKPTVVHYAMANNPACNLANGAGLPASPFRTDCPDTIAGAR